MAKELPRVTAPVPDPTKWSASQHVQKETGRRPVNESANCSTKTALMFAGELAVVRPLSTLWGPQTLNRKRGARRRTAAYARG
jgi:hypothetical protein